MWHPDAGRTADVKFFRVAGIMLVVLALGAGMVSMFGITTDNEPRINIAEAGALEQGAATMFRAVDENITRRHELSLENLSQEGDTP
jgi:hypothetical protein